MARKGIEREKKHTNAASKKGNAKESADLGSPGRVATRRNSARHGVVVGGNTNGETTIAKKRGSKVDVMVGREANSGKGKVGAEEENAENAKESADLGSRVGVATRRNSARRGFSVRGNTNGETSVAKKRGSTVNDMLERGTNSGKRKVVAENAKESADLSSRDGVATRRNSVRQGVLMGGSTNGDTSVAKNRGSTVNDTVGRGTNSGKRKVVAEKENGENAKESADLSSQDGVATRRNSARQGVSVGGNTNGEASSANKRGSTVNDMVGRGANSGKRKDVAKEENAGKVETLMKKRRINADQETVEALVSSDAKGSYNLRGNRVNNSTPLTKAAREAKKKGGKSSQEENGEMVISKVVKDAQRETRQSKMRKEEASHVPKKQASKPEVNNSKLEKKMATKAASEGGSKSQNRGGTRAEEGEGKASQKTASNAVSCAGTQVSNGNNKKAKAQIDAESRKNPVRKGRANFEART